MKQGPNVNKLITYKASLIMVPDNKGIGNALRIMSNKYLIRDTLLQATHWVEQAISVVKTAPDNPYGDNDEAIAGEILKKIEEKKKQFNP